MHRKLLIYICIYISKIIASIIFIIIYVFFILIIICLHRVYFQTHSLIGSFVTSSQTLENCIMVDERARTAKQRWILSFWVPWFILNMFTINCSMHLHVSCIIVRTSNTRNNYYFVFRRIAFNNAQQISYKCNINKFVTWDVFLSKIFF